MCGWWEFTQELDSSIAVLTSQQSIVFRPQIPESGRFELEFQPSYKDAATEFVGKCIPAGEVS